MLDIRFIRENPELVRENIRKKFQDKKLPLVDEVLELDEKLRAAKTEANELRANRNALSKKIGMLMGQAKKDPSKLEEAEDVKAEVAREAARLAELGKARAGIRSRTHQAHDGHPADDRLERSHRPGRQLQRRGAALRRGDCARFRDPLPHGDHGELQRRRSGRGAPRLRQRLLLSARRYRPPALRGARVRARLYDRQGLCVLHSPAT